MANCIYVVKKLNEVTTNISISILIVEMSMWAMRSYVSDRTIALSDYTRSKIMNSICCIKAKFKLVETTNLIIYESVKKDYAIIIQINLLS